MTATMKKTMQETMNLAWQFVRQNGYTMSEALKTAWRNTKLRKAMADDIVRFTFQKVDGSMRLAFGTLKSNLVPPTAGSRTPNPTVQVYYDTEKSAWRCFKRSMLTSIF